MENKWVYWHCICFLFGGVDDQDQPNSELKRNVGSPIKYFFKENWEVIERLQVASPLSSYRIWWNRGNRRKGTERSKWDPMGRFMRISGDGGGKCIMTWIRQFLDIFLQRKLSLLVFTEKVQNKYRKQRESSNLKTHNRNKGCRSGRLRRGKTYYKCFLMVIFFRLLLSVAVLFLSIKPF